MIILQSSVSVFHTIKNVVITFFLCGNILFNIVIKKLLNIVLL